MPLDGGDTVLWLCKSFLLACLLAHFWARSVKTDPFSIDCFHYFFCDNPCWDTYGQYDVPQFVLNNLVGGGCA
jgi:hypothetical protein